MMSKHDLLLDYFNGQLSEEERKAFEEHLTECADCREELRELEELTEDLPFSSEPVAPPEGMKERVLSNITGTAGASDAKDNPEPSDNTITLGKESQQPEPKRKKMSWYKPLMAAVLTLSLAGNGAALIYMSNNETTEPAPPQETPPEETPPEETPEETEQPTLDIVQQIHELQPSEGVDAQATATMIEQSENTNLVVQASDLPPLEGEETYQVWVLEDGTPFRAGTFVTNEQGVGAVSYLMEYEGEHQFDTLAITREPNAHSEVPQGDILLSAPL
ncbi:anti-sigma factor [Lentibacillus sediminis]|uniref:anti-sigma factor n=1 Tax=Lentibacillus sediminis TaxID=1940529 RepID=UPI000C1BD960|nr:anti-sigma factor [Lentibacillus sediminis]